VDKDVLRKESSFVEHNISVVSFFKPGHVNVLSHSLSRVDFPSRTPPPNNGEKKVGIKQY
jgi:hypothetical protein